MWVNTCKGANGLHTAYFNMLWSSFSIGDAYMGVMYGKAYVENGHHNEMFIFILIMQVSMR